MTYVQYFTRGCQTKILSLEGLLVHAFLASPSWLALVRLFFVLEVDDVGVVNVSDVTYADPPTKLTVKAKSKVLMAIPLLQIDGKGEVSKMKISHLF